MKTKPLQLLFALSTILAITLVACEKSNPIDSVDSSTLSTTQVESQIAALPDYEAELLADPVLQVMDENQELAILNDGAPQDLENPFSAAESIDSNGVRHRIFDCLDALNLTQGQKDSIRGAVFHTHQCKKDHIMAIRMINHQIIQHANQERHDLIQQFINGQITLPQLLHELNQLMRRTHYALINNPVKQHQILELRECNHRFFMALHQILTPAQWQQFIDCFR